MSRKIGLTGGTGFIGQCLIREYGDDYEFMALSSQQTFRQYSPKATYVSGTYNYASFLEAFSDCDCIVHVGAVIPKSVSTIGSVNDFVEDLVTTEQLLQAMNTLEIKQIVFSSSVAVYNKECGKPLNEEMLCEPDNSYGLIKVAVETMIHMYERKYDLRPTILRLSQVLGYREYDESSFYAMLMNRAIKNEPLTIFGEGVSTRNYIYVKDAARAIKYAIDKPDCYGTYNIGMPFSSSNTELACAYIEGFESKSIIEHIPVECEDKRYYEFDVSKAERIMGFTTEFDLKTMTSDIKKEMLITRAK